MSNRIQSRKKVLQKVHERSISETVLLLFPLMFIVTLLPLITKMHSYDPHLAKYDFFSASTEDYYDFFLFYKQWIFVGISGLMVIIIAIRAFYKKETLKFSKYLIPIAVYAFLALLSSIFAIDKHSAFLGGWQLFENVFCLLGYSLVIYYAFLVIETEYELKLMINTVAVGALILGIIGTLQAFGLDPFNSLAVKSMIVESGTDPRYIKMVFGGGRVYETLFNPNYVGVYSSFMIPLFTVMLLFSKKVKEYILYSLVILTSVISLFASQSKAGLISIAFSLLMLIIIFFKHIIKKWFIIVPTLAVLVISFIVINKMNDNAYSNAIVNAFKLTKTTTPNLQSIDTSDECVTVTYKNNTFHVALTNTHEINLYDDSDIIPYDVYDYTEDGDLVLQPQDERFDGIFIVNYTVNDDFDFCLFIDDTYFPISYRAVPNTYTYFNRYGRFSSIKTPETAIFDGYEYFASGRGYIWSRTIPLMKKNFFLGSGADNFIFSFPQYDFVGFYNYSQSDGLLNKPHSWYLQIATQTGVVSLLALLAFFGIYFVQSIKLYISNEFKTKSSHIGLAVFICSISFLVSAISNDSNISVSPVFWTIIGIGFVANMMECKIKKSNSNQ